MYHLFINPNHEDSDFQTIEIGAVYDDFLHDRVTAKISFGETDEFGNYNEYIMLKIYWKQLRIVSYDDQRFTGGEYIETGEFLDPEVIEICKYALKQINF